MGIGNIRGRVAVIAFADSGPDLIRIISLRKANENEPRQSPQALPKRAGSVLVQPRITIDYTETPELGPRLLFASHSLARQEETNYVALTQNVLAFFRKRGKGSQTTIHSVLRKYVEVVKSSRK